MDTITASVIGARHLRVARNGQDAAAAVSGPGWAAAAVCDGCSAGAYSEVGARLGAAIVVAALARRLAATTCASSTPAEHGGTRDLWAEVQAEVIGALAALADRMGDDRVRTVVDHFLFTIVAVAATREATSVWAIGDGAYSFGGATRLLGPFADNQPPYLGYALLGDAPRAHVETAPAGTRIVAIATDGALDLGGDVARFAQPRYLEHADRARRELSVLARGREVIDWHERRVVRTAELQDDCAIAVVRVPTEGRLP